MKGQDYISRDEYGVSPLQLSEAGRSKHAGWSLHCRDSKANAILSTGYNGISSAAR